GKRPHLRESRHVTFLVPHRFRARCWIFLVDHLPAISAAGLLLAPGDTGSWGRTEVHTRRCRSLRYGALAESRTHSSHLCVGRDLLRVVPALSQSLYARTGTGTAWPLLGSLCAGRAQPPHAGRVGVFALSRNSAGSLVETRASSRLLNQKD